MALLLSAIFLSTILLGQQNKLELVHADTLTNSSTYEDAAQLRGNVHFKNENLNMFCDSAIFHQVHNWVRAYGRVQINQGDTLNLYSDSLYFDGNSNIGTLQSNVKIRDSQFKLNTDSLKFNANTSIAYYTNHAFITSNKNNLTLTSTKGTYLANSKTFIFKDSVVLNHPDYIVHSDTLEFRAIEEDILIHGPSTIWLDSAIIYTKKAVYHTQTDEMQLWKTATIQSNSQTIEGDSLFFNSINENATGFGNIAIIDTVEKVNLYSDELYKSDSSVLLIGTAQIFQFQNNDTLAIQADTIYQFTPIGSNQPVQIAQSNVVIEQEELIGRCDSLFYSEHDSIIKLQKEPIIWRDKTELSADSIEINLVNKEVKRLNMHQNAFVSIEQDSVHFDQCSGKIMQVFLDSNKIQYIDILNNAETIYFPSEESKDSLTGEDIKTLKGINYMLSTSIKLYFKTGEIKSITFRKDADAEFKPLKEAKKEDLYLKKFKSQKAKKPSSISKIKLH
ncbi:MAG: OstA-like protein [Crocinitomicaceae bacterium]